MRWRVVRGWPGRVEILIHIHTYHDECMNGNVMYTRLKRNVAVYACACVNERGEYRISCEDFGLASIFITNTYNEHLYYYIIPWAYYNRRITIRYTRILLCTPHSLALQYLTTNGGVPRESSYYHRSVHIRPNTSQVHNVIWYVFFTILFISPAQPEWCKITCRRAAKDSTGIFFYFF